MILGGKNSNDIYKCNNEVKSEKASLANIDLIEEKQCDYSLNCIK